MTLLIIGLGAVVMVAAALVVGTVVTALLVGAVGLACWAGQGVRRGVTAFAARGHAADASVATYLPSAGTPA